MALKTARHCAAVDGDAHLTNIIAAPEGQSKPSALSASQTPSRGLALKVTVSDNWKGLQIPLGIGCPLVHPVWMQLIEEGCYCRLVRQRTNTEV
jgi:hypothetical protein